MPAGEVSGKDEEVGDGKEGSAGRAAKQVNQMKWAKHWRCKQEDLALLKETVLASGFSLQALQVGARHATGKIHAADVKACPSQHCCFITGAALAASALGAATVWQWVLRAETWVPQSKVGLLAAWSRTHFTC